MMADLLINGEDALATYGIRMGDGFLDALGVPETLKEYVTNDNRARDGVQYCETIPKVAERKLTLSFCLKGESRSDFLSKRALFYAVLRGGNITIHVPQNSSEYFHLKYTGNSVQYKQNRERTFAVIMCSFNEPNPANRSV